MGHFPELGYFHNEDETDPKVIEKYLSQDDGENPGMNRELSIEEVKKHILNQMYWGFEMTMEQGANWPNLFAGCRL